MNTDDIVATRKERNKNESWMEGLEASAGIQYSHP
jgi:hypothetical protein